MIKTVKCAFLFSAILSCSQVFSADLQVKDRAAFYNQKGIDALESNDYVTAVDCFERAHEIFPENKVIRKNLSLACNNYAIELANKNDVEDAKEMLYRAIGLEEDNVHYRENLANIVSRFAAEYYKNGNYEVATYKLKEALALIPNHAPSMMMLGQIFYQTQDLTNAELMWKKAYALDPKNKNLREMLARLRNEKKVEGHLKKLDAYYFDIRFDKEVVDSEVYDVKSDLQDVYRDVGRDFNCYPNQKIPVILYSQEDFQSLRQTPEWVAGIYDGKIRLPVRKDSFSGADFKRLIWHEYTHAVVFSLTDGKCPVWFNEGLAKYEEAKYEKPDLTPLLKAIQTNSMIRLAQLDSCFSMQTKPEVLNLAYLEAYSFVDFMLDRWSFHVVKGILAKIKNGKSIDKAIYEITSRTPQQIEKEWCDFIQDY